MKKEIKVNVGDLVLLSPRRGSKVGLVEADGSDWYCLEGYYSVAGKIVRPAEIYKVLKRNVVPEKYIPNLRKA